jgi:hypothetical protein
MVRFLHKLGDADCRLTRQDRLFGHPLGSAGGCPTPPRKTDDQCNDCPNNNTPNLIFPAVSGFIDHTPLNYGNIFI